MCISKLAIKAVYSNLPAWGAHRSLINPYNPDTLVILNANLDTLFRLHPENQQDLLNKRFWDIDYWQSLIDHENRTQTLLFILENSYNE